MPRILTIDDEPGMLLVITRMLESAGYVVYTAENGEIGLAVFKRVKPELVFLDIRLPDMDGPEILAEMKKTCPDVPVVMCTGFGDADTVVHLVEKGASGYITKPFKREEVLRIAKNILTTRSLVWEKPVPPKKQGIKLLLILGIGLVLLIIVIAIILRSCTRHS